MPVAYSDKTREYSKEWKRQNAARNVEYVHTSRRRNPAKYLVVRTRTSAKRRGLEFDLTEQFLAERLGPMRCEATGQKLNWDTCFGQGGGKPGPFTPSIDRIDSSKGYTQDNVRIVSLRFNQCKRDLTDEEFAALCREFLRHA